MTKKRYFNLDVCRTIAILLVITNNTLNTVYIGQENYKLWLNTDIVNRIFIITNYILSRLGVPLFLMITGALILKKKFNTKEDIKEFYKKNLLPLVLCVCIWNLFYYFFSVWFNKMPFDGKNLIYILFFMKASTMPHMWYMPMIIGIYIFLPFIANIVQKYDIKTLVIPLICVAIASFIFPNLKAFCNFHGIEALNITSILDLNFGGGGVYGLYIILGYYIYHSKILRKIKFPYILFILLIAFIASAIYQEMAYINKSTTIVYYNFFGILIAGSCLFELICRFQKEEGKFNKICTYLSKTALALYFVHRPLVYILGRYLKAFNPTYLFEIYLYIITVVISIIIVYILSKIKLLKKHVLLIK